MPSLSHKNKKRKINKSSSPQSNSMVDRISDLPDSILCNILYSFPTKFAATTSVLSKRWRYLWLSVLALDFDTDDFKTGTLLCRAMDSIMDRRAITLPIHSFSLKDPLFFSNIDQQVVNKIADYLLQRGIQNLDLNTCYYECYSMRLPDAIFSCRTLKVLKLTNIMLCSLENVSDNVDLDLPSLKTLHLSQVDFDYDHLIKLLLSCPILEDLEIKCCPKPYGIKIRSRMNRIACIALPNLIRARVSAKYYIPLSMVCKAQILCVGKVLKYTCCTQLPMFQNLTHLELNFGSTLVYPRWTWLLAMLELSPKLQSLIIRDNYAPKEMNDDRWKNPSIVPGCLLSQLKTCCIIDYKGKKYDLKFAKYIIENSKVLDTMTINSTCSLDTKAKHRLLKKLSSCESGSATYKLLFD